MAHAIDAHSHDVWAGNHDAVEEARRRYSEDPSGQLVPYASVLYSFRTKERCVKDLEALLPDLVSAANRESALHGRCDERADRLDALSTIIEWTTRQPWCLTCQPYRVAACQATEAGLAALGEDGPRHTAALLLLTQARVLMAPARNRRREARKRVDRAVDLARTVGDPRQRVRVLAKAGILYRRLRRPRGVVLGVRACLVLRVPLNVRAKAVAALIGMDR